MGKKKATLLGSSMLCMALVLMLVCVQVCFAAFSSTVQSRTVFGNKRIVIGTYTSADGAGTTGGDIETGLAVIDTIVLQPTKTSVEANAPVINETLPLIASDLTGGVTIVTDATASGTFIAIGL